MEVRKSNIREQIQQKPIGWQIKFWREKRGLSQSELSEKIGASGKQAIYQYESGKRVPNAEIIAKIAKALNVRYHQFFTEDKP